MSDTKISPGVDVSCRSAAVPHRQEKDMSLVISG